MPNAKPQSGRLQATHLSIDTSSGSGQASVTPLSPNPGNRRKKHATVACLSCKQLRSKCDEKRPCSNCIRVGRQCVYDQTKDARRREYHGRALDELQTKIGELESILVTLRSSDPATVQNLVRLLREGVSVQDALNRVRASSNMQSSKIPSTFEQFPASSGELHSHYSLASPHDHSQQFHDAMYAQPAPMSSIERTTSATLDSSFLDPTLRLQDSGIEWNLPTSIFHNPADTQSYISSSEDSSLNNSRWQNRAQAGFRFAGDQEATPRVILPDPPDLLSPGAENRRSTIPTYMLPAKPWTSVIDDDRVVSHLVSAFFAWHEPAVSSLIARGSFLDAMRSASIPNEACSRILVNSVLAVGCFYTYKLDRPWDRQHEKTLANSFLSEAMRLWVEDDTPRLTTVQALLLMNCAYDLMGRDRTGSKLFKAGMDMATTLQLNQVPAFVQHPHQSSQEQMRMYDHGQCVWAIFSWQATRSHGMKHVPYWRHAPQIDYPPIDIRLNDREEWTPYPMTRPIILAFGHSFLKATALLSVIVNETNIFLLAEYPQISQEAAAHKASHLYAGFREWRRTEPECLDTETNLTPQNLILHMTFYFVTITLCKPFLGQIPPPNTVDFDTANTVAEEGFRNLIGVYRATHGWKSGSTILLYYLSLGALNAIEKMVPDADHTEDENSQAWRASFTMCVNGMWHLLPSWDMARPLLRLVQLSLPKWGVSNENVPAEAAQILDMFQQKIWKPTDPLAVHSDAPWNFPAFFDRQMTSEYGEDVLGMGDMLRHWEGFRPDVL